MKMGADILNKTAKLMKAPVSARLHILLARESSAALIVRRGPSRHTAVIGWDRKSDQFTVGQWFYGRIYERRCDLSPDGRHLIYFAMNGRWDSVVKGAWTAISRAPYLKALTLYAKGDCWNGGGLFMSSREYWLNDGCGHELQLNDSRLRQTEKSPWHESYGGECPGVYYVRLQRDGWVMKYTAPDSVGGHITLFEKRVNAHWQLRKTAHAAVHQLPGKGCYFDEHALWNSHTEETIACPNWEWAEVDGDRLLWAQNGKLFAGHLGSKVLSDVKELQDFNALKFEKLEAPY